MRRIAILPNPTFCFFKNFFFLLVLLCLANISAFGQEGFITTWKTNNQGPTNNKSIKIPTTGNGYNYDVDWENDGTFDDFGVTGNITHEYPAAGTYTVHIRGDFPRIYFNNGGDRKKILSIEQWGNISWTNMENAFYGCKNLVCNATDIPDLSGVTSLSGMFRHRIFDGNSNFSGDLSSWDVSNVTDMSYMFDLAASFTSDLSNWDVDSVTNMSSMFNSAASFTSDLSSWDVSNVSYMSYMFRSADSFNGDLSSWDVSNVTNMQSMFYNAHSFDGDLSSWDVSNVSYMSYMFYNATSFNSDLSNWNLSNVNYIYDMLHYSGLSIENYDATLIGWKIQADTTNIGLDLGSMQGLSYCNAEDARDSLINVYGWTITGDILDCAPLPVDLLDFTARRFDQNAVLLNWTTASEENNQGFEVQRSSDGYNWEMLGYVEGQGTSEVLNDYDYLDRYPLSGINYYRLRQLDFDENFEYSEVVSVNVESKEDLLSVFPNPAQDILTVKNASGQLEIFNALGQRVKTISNNDTPITIDINDLESGYYLLTVTSTQQETTSQRFVVHK